ncbi:MAG: 5'-methylthioadenosine/adenosylhomocysteine nucleosidase [Lachnospiraceae bacterium]|nr:5'-methylthioadenosine/adenosylhomocysteine nucleosidase [Lachnospiraceae bacterium]
MIGIIGAMEEEVTALREEMEDIREEKRAGLTFCLRRLKGQEAAVVCGGVGKVNAAICAQILISEFGVRALLNTGVAGGLLPTLHIGDIVLSTEARYHDYDVTPLGFAPGEMMGMDVSVFPADEGLLALAQESCGRLFPEKMCHTGRVVSGDQFITGRENQERLRTVWGGACAEMEGASIAHTAYLNGVPWLIVRAISDGADDDSPMDFQEFKDMAIQNGCRLILDMLAHMA